MSSPLRLMAVHAHPDDESSKGAATMAKYVRDGVDVLVVTCTGGERGDVLNPQLPPVEPADLPALRIREMAAAAEILGVRQHWLGFVDSGLPQGDPLPPLPEGCFALVPLEESGPALVALIREQRPQVLTTYDEQGGYPHPDHVRTHEISMWAMDRAADPDFRPDLGAAWQVSKVYYHLTFTKPRLLALDEAARQAGLESPYAEWLARWEDKPDDPRHVTTQVECAEYFPLRDRALLAHASQIDPDGRWFRLPMPVQAAAWPTEDYELARSLIDTSLPEDDLFAGLRGAVDGGGS
ncbi:MAG TPA: mycothiol conjugate amidase Mca, partial [Mycobacteriales bacterium]